MSMIGNRVVRKEDPQLLTSGGLFVDDLGPSDALHLTFVRSTVAHAMLTDVDVDEARSMPGVVAVHTAASLGLAPLPPANPMLNQEMLRSWLASERVRYVGEPIVAILTETAAQGVDAAETVIVDYDDLDTVVTLTDSGRQETLLFPEHGSNTAFAIPSMAEGDIFDGCDVVVDLTFMNPRLTAAPIEPRAAVAVWSEADAEPTLTQWSSTQFPHRTRDALAAGMQLEMDDVRVITPDVGGGFGAKNGAYVEDLLVALLAKIEGRPVRWVETRSESLVGLSHARSVETRVKLGGSRDGDLQAFSCHMVQDAGAYPLIGALLPFISKPMATGNYNIPKVDFSAESLVTNTVPVGAYRGAGRPEATIAIERIVDVFAAEISMDPAELRRKNFWAPDDFPLTTPTGANMDSGRYETALDLVMEASDYPGLRAEQQRRLADPTAPLLGLGWCAYVEIANPMGAGEYGSIQVRPDGTAVVLTGSSAHGQGHHTTFAQLASQVTGIDIDLIEVRHGDTAEVSRGGGTGGSRSLQTGGVAVYNASEALVEEGKTIAATMLEAAPEDIVFDADGASFAVAGTPARSLGWGEIASHVEADGERAVFIAEVDFQPPAATFPFGVHLSIVEVDRDTGQVTPITHFACDDAGTIVNPTIVEGQVHGGLAGGIGHALMETYEYDDWGNPLTANFMDYALPAATEFPNFERLALETPTDRNPIGAKGIGESGTIGATPAVQNAVIDALSHLGVRHIEIPTTPRRVWVALNNAG